MMLITHNDEECITLFKVTCLTKGLHILLNLNYSDRRHTSIVLTNKNNKKKTLIVVNYWLSRDFFSLEYIFNL